MSENTSIDEENNATLSPKNLHPRKVSPNTIEQYLKFVKTIRNGFLREQITQARQHDVLPTELVDYLYSKAHTYRPKTFINYRSALLYWLNTQPKSPDVLHAKLILEEGFPRSGFKGHRPNAPTTSLYSSRSMRKRTFRRRDFDKLVSELSARTHQSKNDARMGARANELLLWVHAGLASGLRPIEWETAEWHNIEKGELFVQIAKTKWDTPALPSLSGTPAPSHRTRIVTIDEADRLWVEQHLRSVKRHLSTGKPFKSFYDNNRVYLWLVCKDLFPNRPAPFTLYTLRGQFAANRKKYKTLNEVAAEMGCAPEKAGTYYGKALHAHSSGGAMQNKETEAEKQNQKQKSEQPVIKRFSFPPDPNN